MDYSIPFFFYIWNVEFYISCFEKFYITKCRIYISNVEKKRWGVSRNRADFGELGFGGIVKTCSNKVKIVRKLRKKRVKVKKNPLRGQSTPNNCIYNTLYIDFCCGYWNMLLKGFFFYIWNVEFSCRIFYITKCRIGNPKKKVWIESLNFKIKNLQLLKE